MKSILKSAPLKSIMLAVTLLTSIPAAAYDAREPLVVIRFSSPDVQYQKSLGMAVSEAVKAKRDVVFDVVSGNQNYASQVMRDIANSGIRSGNINFIPSQNGNEVLIFVR